MVRGRTQHGFSYLEVLIALTIIAPAVIGSSIALGGSADLIEDHATLDTARYLADDGLARVLNLHRADPVFNSGAGRGTDEPLGYADDIDDLIGFMESPPIDGAGQSVGAPGEWVRSYRVEWIDLDDPDRVVAEESTKLVRVTIEIQHRGVPTYEAAVLLRRD